MELKDLRDRHLGTMGFVLGAGPSLHFIDPDALKPFVTVAVNSSIMKVPNADYFLSDDIGAKNWNYYAKELKKFPCTKLLYQTKLAKYASHLNQDDIIWFQHKWWYSPKDKSYNPDGLYLTKDPEKPIIGARTSLGSAIHFAYIMGCDPIVLLGSDCCLMGNRRYYWQFPDEPKVYRITGEPVFSRANRGKHKGRPVDSHSMDFLQYWDKLAEAIHNEGTDIHVIDASGGLMESFPKMTFDDVIDKYGERKNDKHDA